MAIGCAQQEDKLQEDRLFGSELKVVAFCIALSLVGVATEAGSQTLQSCPYNGGIPAVPKSCGANSQSNPIPSGIGGSPILVGACREALTEAIASLYSYDDPSCHSSNSALTGIGPYALKFLKDAIYVLPPSYKERVTLQSNFQATLYCSTLSNTLILSFRGSVSLTKFDQQALNDWFDTNLLQGLGERPLQYQAAEDVAALINKDRSSGVFDGACGLGSGRPALLLAGHSKGGGEAQFAAVRNKLEAFVYNSAPVNPQAFSAWALDPHGWEVLRRIGAARACGGMVEEDFKQYALYFATGKIHDIRLVNDPLTKYLFPICGRSLPHAPIEWLADTLACSSGDGHSIETVVRELHACAP